MHSTSALIDMTDAIRARMGVIVSASNRMVESQLRFCAPAELAIHVNRMRLVSRPRKPLSELTHDVMDAARMLAAAKVDIIVLQASYIAMEDGPAGEARLNRAILEATGTQSMTSPQAMVEAMRFLGLRRIVIVSPFQQASNELEKAYLTALGFDVLHDLALGIPDGEPTIAIQPARWVEATRSAMRPDADGYFLSGSNTTIVESIPMIEAAVGKPVVSSTQATLWAAIQHLKPKLGAVSVSRPIGQLCERF